jgi:hypothetical protein
VSVGSISQGMHAARSAVGSGGRTAFGCVSAVGWVGLAELDQRRWLAEGRYISKICTASNWWIGDWVRYGNQRYGQKYELAAKTTGYETKSLVNMVLVSSRFEIERRRPHISWSHHAELAALQPPAQEQWLDRLEREPMSVRSLRQELKRTGNASAAAADRVHEPPDRAEVCPSCGRLLPRSDGALESRTMVVDDRATAPRRQGAPRISQLDQRELRFRP